MGENKEYNVGQIIDSLAGGLIVGAVERPPGGYDEEVFGLLVLVGNREKAVWILSDDDGNGPGCLEITDIQGEERKCRTLGSRVTVR